MSLTEREIWYRFDDAWTVGEAPFLSEYPISRHTAKCVVIGSYGIDRFVRKNANKRFAYPTKELALQSYIIRKQRQIQHAAATHDNAKANLAAAEALARGELPPQKHLFELLS